MGFRGSAGFPAAARVALSDTQLRRNLGKATTTIRAKRAGSVAEVDDWEALRDGGRGDQGPGAGDAARAARAPRGERHRAPAAPCTGRATAPRPTRSSAGIARDHGSDEVIKVKSLATDEIGLNEALERRGHPGGGDRPGRADRPARRRRRRRTSSCPPSTRTGRRSPRCSSARSPRARSWGSRRRRSPRRRAGTCATKFLSVPVAVSGANFGVAETGTICVVESEGNGRMCTTLPRGADHASWASRRCCPSGATSR